MKQEPANELIPLSQEKEDLKSFLVMEEIPLTANVDIDDVIESIDKYIRSISNFEATHELNMLTA